MCAFGNMCYTILFISFKLPMEIFDNVKYLCNLSIIFATYLIYLI